MGHTTIVNGKKVCRGCGKLKDCVEFNMFMNRKIGQPLRKYINSRCKECASKASADWANKNRERLLTRQREQTKKWKEKIFEVYGKRCACCGESNEMFLTVDHVNNDGCKHRRTTNKQGLNVHAGNFMYKWIVENNFPNTIQLLCWNCNCGRYRNGGVCPHKQK